ncbi:MAG: hypothetical protein JO057_05350 [Chloroflexi bacterium]|nr:hypothetical protein [Chloroflexota bacterium]
MPRALSQVAVLLAAATLGLSSCTAPTAPPEVAPTAVAAAPASTTTAASTTSAQPAAATSMPAAPTISVQAWTPPAPTKTSGCISQGGLPDSACTPGAVHPQVTQANITATICKSGYSASVRPDETVTEKIKRDEMAAYSLQGQRLGDYELDHLISLELGGAPTDVANLWPEPWNGDDNAHMKDAVENSLHEQVCRGAMPLAEAQRAIATNWLAEYTSRRLSPETARVD